MKNLSLLALSLLLVGQVHAADPAVTVANAAGTPDKAHDAAKDETKKDGEAAKS